MALQPAMASTRSKTDVIYMNNGDVITCEIRSLDQGQLTIKQDYSNSTSVLDWRKVDHFKTKQLFVVSDTKGHVFDGILSERASDHMVIVQGATTEEIPHDDVISIVQTGTTFWRSFNGDFDVGLTFAQSNHQKNVNTNGDLNYQGRNQIFGLSASSTFTSQQETNNTRESSVKAEYFKQLRKSDFYGGAIANFLSSSEQQISIRSSLGGALAIRPIYTNKTILALIGGLAYTDQQDNSDTTSTASNHSVDAALAAQYSTFRFDSTTFDTTLWVYPGLTTPGRVRMTLNQDIYYKFYKDFYVRASFYDNFDNRPVMGAPENNLGVSSTVGWSFR